MLAVRLFHGREHPDDQLQDWGSNGPHLGPFHGVHITYGVSVSLVRDSTCIADLMIGFEDGLLYYDGVYYGDIEVYTVGEEYEDELLDEPVESLTVRPAS